MPQFDQTSFLNQVFWLFFFFFNFYFFLTYYFLPFLCEILKFRKKKIIQNNTNYENLKLESSYQIFIESQISNKVYTYLEKTLNNISIETFETIKSIKQSIFFNLKLKNNLKNFWIQFLTFPKNFN